MNTQRRWRGAAAGWLLAGAMLATAAERPAPAIGGHAPKLVCREPTFAFGEQDAREEMITHTFVLRNEGDLSLEIRQLRPACGCTLASISERIVPPGQETRVTAKLSLQGRSGPQHKTITVESNDPAQPAYLLALDGTVVVDVQVQPAMLFLGRVARGTVTRGAFTVQAQRPGVRLQVLGAQPNSTNLTVQVETLQPDRAYRFTVQTQGDLPAGAFRGNVQVTTSHARFKTIDVPVFLYITAPGRP